MDMQMQQYNNRGLMVDRNWLEEVLFHIGDIFEIRIVWEKESVVFTGAMALIGGLVGGLAGGRVGAAVGAGLAGAAGAGVATVISLREAWARVKEKLMELPYVILNFLRTLDRDDYQRGYEILMACARSRRVLVMTILEFIAEKLGREVLSNINNNHRQLQ